MRPFGPFAIEAVVHRVHDVAHGAQLRGTLYRTTGTPFTARPDPAATTNTAVGTASLAFADASHGTFPVDMNGSTRTKAIEREQLAGAPPICD